MRMAQAAGARLWHTNAWESGGVGLVPEADRMRSLGADIAFFRAGSVVLVGGDARRYLAEDAEQRGGSGEGGRFVGGARPPRCELLRVRRGPACRYGKRRGAAPLSQLERGPVCGSGIRQGGACRRRARPGCCAGVGRRGPAGHHRRVQRRRCLRLRRAGPPITEHARLRQRPLLRRSRVSGGARHAGWSGASGECPGDGRFWRTHPALVRGGRMWQRDGRAMRKAAGTWRNASCSERLPGRKRQRRKTMRWRCPRA